MVDPGDARPSPVGGGNARAALPWIAGSLVVVLAFAAVVITLNASFYSASGFVSRYLDALARRDLATALETPGVTIPAGASTAALTRDAMPGLGEHRILSERDAGGGMRMVTAAVELDGTVSRTEFTVHQEQPLLLAFSSWRFVDSPVAALTVTVRNDSGFRINGFPLTAPQPDEAQAGVHSATIAVLTPSTARLDQSSRYLTADSVSLPLADASPQQVEVVVRANDRLVESVQEKLDEFLDECATQQVLQPSGCPFRRVLENRVQAAPQWSMIAYPQIAIEPDLGDDGEFAWFVRNAPGTAHIVVDVVSLFDGTRSTLDEDVPFTVSLRITIRDDGGLDIRAI